MANIDLKATVRKTLERRYQGLLIRDASLGIIGNEQGVVAGTRPGHVYVKFGQAPAIEVLNKRVQAAFGQLVYVGYDPVEMNVLQVLSLGTMASEYTPGTGEGGGGSIINPGGYGQHAATHSLYGSDPVFLWLRQLMDGRIGPAASQPTGPALEVWPALLHYDDGSYAVLEHQIFDMTAFVPASGSSCWAAVYASGSGATVGAVASTPAVTNPPPFSDLPDIPDNAFLLGYTRMYPGQTSFYEAINYTDILDIRTLFPNVGASGSPGGGGFPNPMTQQGDFIIGGASGSPARFPKGSDGQALQMVSGSPTWTTGAVVGELPVYEDDPVSPSDDEQWFLFHPATAGGEAMGVLGLTYASNLESMELSIRKSGTTFRVGLTPD